MIPLKFFKTFLASLGCCLVFFSCYSQISQPFRFEKERKFNDDDFTIIPLESEGIALIREQNKYKSGNQFWEVILLDTALQEKASLEIEVDVQDKLIGYEYAPGFVYLLFVRKEFKGEMELVSINTRSMEVVSDEIKPELNFKVTQFLKAGENFVFGGYVDTESAALLYLPSTKHVKMIPGFFQKNVELLEMRTNLNQTFNTILIDRNNQDNQTIIFRTFDSSGNQLLETVTRIDSDMIIQNGMSSTLRRDDMMILGTWGKRNTKQASGFYASHVNPFGTQNVQRVYFGQLEHYLEYLKPKKAAKVKERTADALERGKIPDFTNYVIPFKIVEYEKGFLLLAESFVPSSTYSQNSPTPYGYYPNYYPYSPYGGYYPGNRMYPIPYQYNQGANVSNDQDVKCIHGIVMAMDNQGKVLWDYSLKFDNVKRDALEQSMDFILTQQNVFLLYKKESELIMKKITLSSGEEEEIIEKITPKNSTDEVRSENTPMGTVKQWYRNNFYVWGYQTVRNKYSADKTREVFYINKVVVP
ncbi:MAG: hypothetical protein WAZ98_11425 [Cyclobacteriaceae bacterium]